MKILNWMQKAEEVKFSSKADSHRKDASDKMVQNKIRRQEKKKRSGK